MWWLWLACIQEGGPSRPESANAQALQAQVQAGEHARAVTEEMEAMEALLLKEELTAQELEALRGHLEAAKAEAAAARESVDAAEAALGGR